MNDIAMNTMTEGVGALVEKGFPTLAVAAGFPAAAVLSPLAKGLVVGLIENCYNDYAQRTLSISETKKLNTASQVALEVFRELSEKDRILAWEISIAPSYEEYAYEVADHVIQEAIRQSETKKAEVLGWYYGKRIYQGPGDWQDMHQIITMAGALSFRQIVLIRLINEGFIGITSEMFITNPSACVEVSRMQDYGLWMTDKVTFKDDASAEIQIKDLQPTVYSKMVGEALMLDKLSEEDIKRTIESLALSEKGEPAEGITKEDFDASNFWTEYNEEEEKLSFKQGRPKAIRDVVTLPDDITHLTRGKDLMKEASDYAMTGNMLQCIDYCMNAIKEFKKCKSERVGQPAVEDALKELKLYFVSSEGDVGGLRILHGKRNEYEAILSDLNGEFLAECKTYLAKAVEKHLDFEKIVSEEQSRNMVEQAIAKAEAENRKKETDIT